MQRNLKRVTRESVLQREEFYDRIRRCQEDLFAARKYLELMTKESDEWRVTFYDHLSQAFTPFDSLLWSASV